MSATNEPKILSVPAGEFLMGEDQGRDARPAHRLSLPAFRIAQHPITNTQYLRFVQATVREWVWEFDRRPEKDSYPAVGVSWHDARAYCDWLTGVWKAEGRIASNEVVRLPTEAEWEKAARGQDGRVYPWGDVWDKSRCNTEESGRRSLCPVGAFPNGTSPYGCHDMAGQVWEWTISLWGSDFWTPEFQYPYDPTDGREELDAGQDVYRVVRGGSFDNSWSLARCAFRNRELPHLLNLSFGFRIVVAQA